MALTIQQLETFSNTKPELRQITEEIIKYLQANPGGGAAATSLILTSPDATQWQVTVNDDGVLITTEI